MGVTETVFGKPPQTTINQTPATRPPGYSFARDFFNSLSNVAQQPYPTYQGQLDPGMSPTMANTIRRAQGYGTSGPPEILAGVQGSLGRFMNPSFINPAFRVQGGAPDYANQNPNQRVFGGRTAGNLGSAFGVSGPTYAPKQPGAGGGSGLPVAFGGPPPGAPPPAPTGGMKSGGQVVEPPGWFGGSGPDYQNPVSGGGTMVRNPGMAWDPYAPPGGNVMSTNDYPSFPGDGVSTVQMGGGLSATGPLESITGGGLQAPAGNLGNDMLEAPGSQNPPQRYLDMAMRYGPEYAAQRWREFQAGQLPGQQPASTVPPAFGGTYGGYTAQQLQADPSLVSNLGQRGLSRWNAALGIGGQPTGLTTQTPGSGQRFYQYGGGGQTKPQVPPAFQPGPPQASPWK